ncbi:uncharacterized protein DNG_08295 [Cephalotrichum gorgonifer]|uniref:Succinate dehydrogenase assembly factor 4, mitochondrial n=1 Tax=Cephalotrichum gorgonifer TaxID=2041049 RepID=A0AAE8SYC8_9PEZI|nr:uncharacterized protein DNG_08295 [Cephalotrichum gorgonifer]
MSFLLRQARPALLRLPAARLPAARAYSTKKPAPPSPAPPRLPEKEQAEFEALLRAAQGKGAQDVARGEEKDPFFENAKPEFGGEVNPKTGEAGGPKTNPLRWGSEGDWSYNGKVTDF